jgi:hypothetical protein
MTNCQPISITLSPAQVDQIVRAAASGGTRNFPTLISTTLIARARLAERAGSHDQLDGDTARSNPRVDDAEGTPGSDPQAPEGAGGLARPLGEPGGAHASEVAARPAPGVADASDEARAADSPHEDPPPASNGARFPQYSGDARLSRSLLRGLSILTCFRPGLEERGILELAGELGMSASTTHRYVATLVELGLLERCPRSRKYRLPVV